MHKKSSLPSLGAALLMGCIVACSDSTSPSGASSTFNAQVAKDLAPTAGADIAADVDLYNGTSNSSAGSSYSSNVSSGLSAPTHTAANWTGLSCILRPLRGLFDCPRFVRNGHTDSISYQFFQSGTGMDSLHLAIFDTSAIAYTHDSTSFADTGSHHIDASVSLLDSLVTWNATRSGNIKSVRTGPNVTKTYQLVSSDTTTNVQFYVPRSRHHYPISGTIIRNYMVTRTREGNDTTQHTSMLRVVVTFNGTQTPEMTIDGNASYNVDLVTAKVTSH